MQLSILIPCFNESKYLPLILKKIEAIQIPDFSKQIIIVDDGSTDGTLDIIKKDFPQYNLIVSKRNYGKAHAIRLGLPKATGDIILIQDADLEYDPVDYLALIKPFIEDNAQVVYGSRILKSGNGKSSELYYLGGRFLSFMTNIIWGA